MRPGGRGARRSPGLGLRHGRRPSTALIGVTALLVAVLTGCGIRATAVPTKVGPAPSRASCAPFTANAEAESAQGVPVQIYLVCTSQLVAVDRTVRIPEGKADEEVRLAQALLGQLRMRPSAPERQAGYTTDVLSGITVSGGREGEPPNTLRLGIPTSALNPYALAQVVCTFADAPTLADGDSVILSGPGTEPARQYHCTSEVRAHPGTATPPTSPVGSKS